MVKALDALDEVIALIRRSANTEEARNGLIALLDIDEIQADAILAMQLRRLSALERQKIIDELAEIERVIADLRDILAKPERQRAIVRDELAEIVDKYGDERRTKIIAAEGDVADEDLIAREDVVVTITETGYAKRTKTDLYRSQRRGGKGVQGAGLKQDDIVAHFFVSSTHDWILFFTTKGRVYRAKAYELPEAARTARGQHVANLLAFQPEERIAQVIQIKSHQDAPIWYLPRVTVWLRSPNWRTSTPTVPAVSPRSTCAATTNSLPPACAVPKTTCCWSPHRASRSGSPRPMRRCGRWAARPPASRACASTPVTDCFDGGRRRGGLPPLRDVGRLREADP